MHTKMQVFHYYDGYEGKDYFFPIALFDEARDKAFLVKDIPIGEEMVDNYRTNRGIEKPILDAMTPEQRDKPVYSVEFAWPNGQMGILTIDGHHRTVKRWEDGFKTIDSYIFPRSVWEPIVKNFKLADFVEREFKDATREQRRLNLE